MTNHEREIQSTRFASALLAWQDFVSVKEHYGADCVRHVKDAITLDVLSNIEPVKFDNMEDMKPVFLHEYQAQLTGRSLWGF